MKTSLCETCVFGLVREWDCLDEKCPERHFSNKCLLGEDYPGNYITSCNQYNKVVKQTTYHDPDFGEYEKKVGQICVWPICSVCKKPDTPYVDPESCQCHSSDGKEKKIGDELG